jgi:hypothetical protein
MAFGSNANNVPMLHNYAAAVAHEAKVKPIRGRAVECKPVGQRNITHATIRNANDDIVVRIYNTDIVRYKPDGRIIINQGGHASNTTRAYLSALMHEWFGSHQGETVWFDRPNDKTYILHDRADNIFVPNPDRPPRLIFTNPKPQVIYKKNRAALKEVRARYAPFIRYMKNIQKLQGGGGVKGFPRPGYISHLDMSKLILSSELEDNYLALACFAWPGYHNPVTKFENFLLHHHNHEVFTKVTVPLGELAHNRYRAFF